MVALNLTAQQIAYAEGLLDGKSGSAAYRAAYNTRGGSRVVARKAVDLKKHPAVQHYLQSMRADSRADKILGRQRSLELLSDIARNNALPARDQIKAIETLSKLQGWDAPKKSEVRVTGSLLHRIRQGKRKTASPTT